jgi:hypothetical protein
MKLKEKIIRNKFMANYNFMGKIKGYETAICLEFVFSCAAIHIREFFQGKQTE